MSVGLGEGLKIEYLTPPTGDAAVSGLRSHFGTPWSTLSSVKAPAHGSSFSVSFWRVEFHCKCLLLQTQLLTQAEEGLTEAFIGTRRNGCRYKAAQ